MQKGGYRMQPPDTRRRSGDRLERPTRYEPPVRRTASPTADVSWHGQRKAFYPQHTQQKSWLLSKKRILKRHVVLLATLLCAFAVVMSIQTAQVHARELQIVEARDQLTQVLTEVDALRQQVAFAATDAFVEQQARDQYGYLKPGETRYQREESPVASPGQ